MFAGDAGSGESEIRRWIIEKDWLETIVALPEQLFYNTGIATYLWVLTDRKAEQRRGKVELIDAREMWEPMPKSLGNKRRRLSVQQIEEILARWRAFDAEDERVQVHPNRAFGYRRVTVERPLRLRYRGGAEAVAAAELTTAFDKLAPAVQTQVRELLQAVADVAPHGSRPGGNRPPHY
jgi:type I restriction enzyme M protein